jgi:uncharacterized protein YacL
VNNVIKKIFRWILTAIGVGAGSELSYILIKYIGLTNVFGYELKGLNYFIGIILGGIITGIIVFLISPWIINLTVQITSQVERLLQSVPTNEVLVGALGLLIGLVIASLISSGPINLIPIPWLAMTLSVLVYGVIGYLGISIATKKREDLLGLASLWRKGSQRDKEKTVKQENKVAPKILDTSVILTVELLISAKRAL